jgi:hypothetical protein
MPPDQTVTDDELELDEDGFAGPPAKGKTRPNGSKPDGDNAAPWLRNASAGNGGEDVEAELARLRAENARLRAVAGLEGRRDEPVTVGDLLDANEAQAAYIRTEVERAVGEHGDEIADYVAACVEHRLLDSLNGEGDDDIGNGAKAKRKTKKAEELPVERVTKIGYAKLYQGDDEPDEVAYVDVDTGYTETRKGRRRGHPYAFVVEAIED